MSAADVAASMADAPSSPTVALPGSPVCGHTLVRKRVVAAGVDEGSGVVGEVAGEVVAGIAVAGVGLIAEMLVSVVTGGLVGGD